MSIGRIKCSKNTIAVLRNTSMTSWQVMNRGFMRMNPKVNSSRLYGCFKMNQIQQKLLAHEVPRLISCSIQCDKISSLIWHCEAVSTIKKMITWINSLYTVAWKGLLKFVHLCERQLNEIRKIFLQWFLAKTRRVNKIAMKIFSKNLVVRSRLWIVGSMTIYVYCTEAYHLSMC